MGESYVVDRDDTQTRILVVDDEIGIRQGCQRALNTRGHSVDTVSDLTAARRALEGQPFELFLLDVMLPDGSGLDLIEDILGQDSYAICIVMTGFGTVEMAVEAIKRGAYDFLSKPFTSDELVLAVERGIERRRLKLVEVRAAELVRARDELEKLDRVKSQLMLKVAHELRAPVAAVQSYINLMIAGYVAEDEVGETLGRVQLRLQEMLDLIADLLELSSLKQSAAGLTTELRPQPLDSVLEEVYEVLRPQAQERGQAFDLEIRQRPTVVAEREHLRQLWMNLLSNAIKYTPEGGRIRATLDQDAARAIGSVEDTGMGISGDEIPALFQEFYRSDRAKASGEIGTGLGLSIVKEIIDHYGGEIDVDSTPEEGSCFTFTLPAEPAAARLGLPLAESPPSDSLD
jgi:signal transduction histidine kinase